MNTEKKYYKLKLCNFYERHGKCTKGDNCNYAHGEDELKDFKKECINGLKCFKKDCLFLHPDNWNYENNIRVCEYYLNGYCVNENNCNFKHINENIKVEEIEEVENNYEEINENDLLKNIDINNDDEFPKLKENINPDIIKTNDDIIEEEKIKYDVNEIENKSSPDIEIFVNGIKNDMLNINPENNNDIKDFNEIEKLINSLKKDFIKYNKELKIEIDETFIKDKNVNIDMKISLNKIMSKIVLLENNYQDIIKNNKN